MNALPALARGDQVAAQNFFEQAKPFYETQVRDHPEVGSYHANLGLVYAYLGRKDDAIRKSRRAVELGPENSDALDGPAIANNLALVYARTHGRGRAGDHSD